MNIISLLHQPYPIEASLRERMVAAVATALFVPLFLGVFTPFGIDSVEGNRFVFIAGYGVVTFLVFVLNSFLLPFFFPALFQDTRWSVGKHLVLMLWYLVAIAAGNVLYTWLNGYVALNLVSLLYFLLVTSAIGIFPVSFLTLLNYFRSQRHYRLEAQQIDTLVQEQQHNQELPEHTHLVQTVVLYDEEEREVMRVESDALLYIKAADNYVEVLTEGQAPVLLRSSLKRIEERGLPQNWYRCHRSYIVNMQKVQHIQGNSQGLRLVLHPDISLPVARSKSAELREMLG